MSEHDTLHIHETVIADAAFKIACDLANKHPEVGGLPLAAVEATILHCLRHQLHLQSTWCTEDEEFGSRQFWAPYPCTPSHLLYNSSVRRQS